MHLKIRSAKPDIDQRHAAALPLDQRVGRQRGGERSHGDLARRYTGLRQHRADRIAHANSQIGASRQRLSRGDHLCLIADQHRVGIGAARVHTQ